MNFTESAAVEMTELFNRGQSSTYIYHTYQPVIDQFHEHAQKHESLHFGGLHFIKHVTVL